MKDLVSTAKHRRIVERPGRRYRDLDCPRCGSKMRFLRRQSVKERSLLLDEWGSYIDVDWYICPGCDYLELYRVRKRQQSIAHHNHHYTG